MRRQGKIVLSKGRSSGENGSGRVGLIDGQALWGGALCAEHWSHCWQRERETDAGIYAGSPKLDNRRLEKGCLAGWVSMSAATFRRWGSGFGVKSMKASIHPAFYQQSKLLVCVSWHALGLVQTAECHLAQFLSNRFQPRPLVRCTEMTPSGSSDLAPVEHLWDTAEWEIFMDAQPTTLQPIFVRKARPLGNVSSTLLNLRHEKLRSSQSGDRSHQDEASL